jgi:hypothetical protein
MYTINLTEDQLNIVKRALCASVLSLVAKLKNTHVSRPDIEQRISEINDLLESLPKF